MNRRAVAIALGAVVVLTAVVAGGLFLAEQVLTSYYQSYGYRVAVETETDLTDVTLYVPLPTREGATLADTYAGVELVENPPDQWYADDGPHVPPARPGDADWTVAVVETESGPMAALRATSVEAGTYVFGTDTQLEPGRIETADPWQSDFVLTPVSDVSEVDCPSAAEDGERCYTFDTRAYVEYEASDDASVTVTTSLHGQTDWGFVMANGWNWFDQRSDATVDGPSSDWVETEGTLRGGAGTYP